MTLDRTMLWKKVKVLMPHCSVCKEMLSGEGSVVLPYRCECGVWEVGWPENNWRIKVKAL